MKKKLDLSDDFRLLEIFRGRCPCRRMAVTIHELEPRSRGKSSMRFTNRTPICFECHNEFHRKGASKKNIVDWKDKIEKYLRAIGTWEQYHD